MHKQGSDNKTISNKMYVYFVLRIDINDTAIINQ